MLAQPVLDALQRQPPVPDRDAQRVGEGAVAQRARQLPVPHLRQGPRADEPVGGGGGPERVAAGRVPAGGGTGSATPAADVDRAAWSATHRLSSIWCVTAARRG
nr:hypothetical protein GCM10020241_15810 [Streptoalloteichus tenebrarius]